jgi:UDP-N-acetylmuramoylalanine--D-glutamate ligase
MAQAENGGSSDKACRLGAKQVNYSGMKVTVMGLGLHGGGLESARYLARRGAEVTVTDLRDETVLAPSIAALEAGEKPAFPIRYVLGRHEKADFENVPMVIKNPGVRPDSPFLRTACEAGARIETDISIFLAESPARLCVVTGSKGKSVTASALHWVLAGGRNVKLPPAERLPGKACLGGNITVSPLGFLDELEAGDDVVLELSSWQLGDLRGRFHRDDAGRGKAGLPLLKPRAAVITAIMADHLDRYGTMDAYVADKRVIYQGQNREDVTVAGDDFWGRSFREESPARVLVYSAGPLPEGCSGGWLDGPDGPGLARFYGILPPGAGEGETVEIVPAGLLCPGRHQKKNFLAAALALLDMGLAPALIRESLGSFAGIEHRLEFFHESRGIRFYNDTAATIPEAAAAALEAFEGPVILVAGGSDKNLDFGPLVRAAPRAKALVLLAGTGSEKLKSLLDAAGLSCRGPCGSVGEALREVLSEAAPGDTVVLSPGCASFDMFLNEFDRGRKWKEAVLGLDGAGLK